MNEIKIIENELVPVYETSAGEKVVYGTELYDSLGSKQDFSNWVKSRLKECDAVENEDFTIILSKSTGGRPRNEYIIKLDTAKEMAMLERNEKGKQVRRYFITVEKKYKDAKSRLPQNPMELLKLHYDALVEVNGKVDDLSGQINTVKSDFETFKQDMPILGIEESLITNAVAKKGVSLLGGKNSCAYQNKSLRTKLYSDIHRQLRREFGVTSYKAIKRCQSEIAVNIINDYKPPLVLADEILCENSQVNLCI